ncbi:uncharacterized protein LOC127652964, partial [Xyrauchen texanus]|uniref:uncharacterized protein LOC127652964 n=1 Tax=Xyrauchen texanus TaxID=154827 RepID=UPI002241BCBE
FFYFQGTESKDFNIEQQPEFLPVSQGDNVNIQCKILIESCAEDHSVHWFRHGATESHQGILYIQSGGHGQCKRSAEAGSKTQRCVYDLSKRNISLSDVGIYYCAIAACGEIMLGNGTTLKHTDNANKNDWDPLLLSLISSNVVSLIVIVIFLVDLCKNKRKRQRGSTKSSTSQSCETGDFLNYAAVSFVPIPSSSRRTRGLNNRDLAEYSEVHYKLRDQMP